MRKRSEWNLIGASDSLSLEALGEIGSESEPPFRVLHQPAELPPSLKRLLRRVLGLHIPKVLAQVALHLRPSFFTKCENSYLYIYIFTDPSLAPFNQSERNREIKLRRVRGKQSKHRGQRKELGIESFVNLTRKILNSQVALLSDSNQNRYSFCCNLTAFEKAGPQMDEGQGLR
jgi:hypothetical protein